MAGLYIHVPFCHSKCAYCDFYSMPQHMELYGLYAEAIVQEWDARRCEITDDVTTVYIGGGTPSVLPDAIFSRIVTRIGLCEMPVVEFTVEVNPEDVSVSLVSSLRKHGVNRVSMGVQSLNDKELEAVGRRHTASQALESISILKNGGFDNISCDLIYGLPYQTLDSWKQSVDELLDSGISHLSAYSLTYESGTRLWSMLQAGKLQEMRDDMVADMYQYLCSAAAAVGLEHYEISNFGYPGKHSLHNSSYWNQTPYLGLGPGAHSFDGCLRRANIRNIKKYLKAPESSFEVEESTPDSLYNDHVITALRTADGISPECFDRSEIKIMSKYETAGLIQMLPDGNYRITEQGWLLSDTIMSDLLRV